MDRLLVPDFLVGHIDTRGDPILPSRVVAGVQLVLRAVNRENASLVCSFHKSPMRNRSPTGAERFETRSVNDNCPYSSVSDNRRHLDRLEGCQALFFDPVKDRKAKAVRIASPLPDQGQILN